jgi:putative aldouronate transport system substrate-binding protein
MRRFFMKKSIAIILSIILILAFALPAAAISTVAVTGINLDKSKIWLNVGQTYDLKVTLTPANTTQRLLTYVTWNQKVATIDKTGKITGVGEGTATILVYTSNQKIFAKCNVAVAEDKTQHLLWSTALTTGAGPDKNAYVVKEIDKMFNVDMEPNNVLNTDKTKMGLMYSSGTIPDVNLITFADFDTYNSQGLFREIPMELVKEYAPEMYKRTNAAAPYKDLPSMVKGKLYGIPHTLAVLPDLAVFRSDWLAKVNAKAPTTLAEFENVAKLFSQNDPDGNGKKDTYGLAWGTLNQMGFNFIRAAFNVQSDQPNISDGNPSLNAGYYIGSDGKLQAIETSENYKKFLKYIQGLYRKGYIYPDLTLPKSDDVNNLFANGKVGFSTSSFTWFMPKYRPTAWYTQTFIKNPAARTEYFKPLKTVDGKDSQFYAKPSIWAYFCIGKNTTDAQLIKILQILERMHTDLTFHNLIWRGVEGKHYTVNDDGMAIFTKQYETVDAQAKEGIKFFIMNDRVGVENTLSYGKDIETQSNFIANNYQPIKQPLTKTGTLNSVNKELGTDIAKVRDEFFIKALSGTIGIDTEWNAYVDRMKKAGLDKVMDEWNKIYIQQKASN